MPEYFRVKEPFAYGNSVATVGQIWSSDGAAFKGREQFFEPVSKAAERTNSIAVETASAAPGETRSFGKRAAKRVAAKPGVVAGSGVSEEL